MKKIAKYFFLLVIFSIFVAVKKTVNDETLF